VLVAQGFEELYYSATAPAKEGKPWWSLNKIPVKGGSTITTTPKSALPRPAGPWS